MGSKIKRNKMAGKKNPEANMVVEVSGNHVIDGGNKVITDIRFEQSQRDPKFQDVSRSKTKVAIDPRFSRMFTNKNFSTSPARVDKRGRAKQDGNSSQSAFRHYYQMDDEERKQKKQHLESDDDDKDVERENKNGEYDSDDAAKSKSEPESESESESESLGEKDEGKGEGKEDITDDDDNTSTDTNEEDGVYQEEEITAWQMEENVPEIGKGKETQRLAIVNLDWSQVRAVDLFVLLSSFLPKTGQILSVSVYPSEFGLKRMKKEVVRGPVGLSDDEDRTNKDDDNEKLRDYELKRLWYYFAVVVCESINTAAHLHKSCNDVEFERSSNILDVRFIPDSWEFTHLPRDVATEAPANYEGIDFQTRALQLSKIDLTWDENEPRRSKKLKRKINVDQESAYVKDEQELKEFIASSESETDEDENHGKRKTPDAYRDLLQSGDEDEEDKGMDMEVTFNTGLEDLSKKILEKKDKKSETVWEASLRKKKEKKKARKNKSMDSDQEPVEESGDFFADRKREMRLDKEGEASKAELELLLGDDDGNVKGHNLKRKKSKGRKGKREGMDEVKIRSVDNYDPRFSILFTRPDYALDPMDPQFKRSAAYVRHVAHKHHKGDLGRKGGQQHEQTQASEVDTIDTKKDKHEISMLLKGIKMKSKQLLLPSDGNKSRRK